MLDLYGAVESEKIMEREEFAPFYTVLEQSAGYTPASFIIEEWSAVSEALSFYPSQQYFYPSSLQDAGEVLDAAAGK